MTTITFAQPDMPFLIALLILGAGAYLFLLRAKGLLLLFLRMTVVLILLVLALQPELVHFTSGGRPVLALAVDISQSMKRAGRLEAVKRFLDDHARELGSAFATRLYVFSSGAAEAASLSKLPDTQTGTSTDINRSLWEIRRETGGSLAGIVLFSDGNHNGEALSDSWTGELNVPVFPVAAGAGKTIRDVAVRDLRVSDFAFKDTPMEISVSVAALGYRGKSAAVSLRSAAPPQDILASRAVSFASDNDVQEVSLRLTPGAAGESAYAVEVSPLPGEVTAANNRRTFTLETIREKLRVLYLCGQPGPEYSFLRHTLKNDPLVELVSFVILRNPENIALVPENDLALIPFPVHDLFTRDLASFDILVLENFTHRRFGFQPDYLANIGRWVTDKGGGLIMIAGDNSFSGGGWAGTAVADVLPVTLDPAGESYDGSFFRASCANSDHFITRLDDDAGRNRELWSSLPELEGCLNLPQRKGADVLLRQPGLDRPVLAVWQKGKGRTAALATNTTWRWSLGSSTPEHYTRFWKNTVRYLAGMGETKPVHAVFDKQRYFSGDKYTLKVRLLEQDPSTGVQVYAFDRSGRKTLVPMARRGGKEWSGEGTFQETGEWKFQVTALRNGVPAVQEVYTRAVEPSLLQEETVLGINERFLRDLADSSGGLYFTPATFSFRELASTAKKVDVRTAREKIPLWTSPWLLALAAFCLLAEWLVRKRKGLY